MWKIATSIVLIFAQLAVLAAAPLYVCTSADGTQHLEWGACGCDDGHGHGALASEDWRNGGAPCHEPHLAQLPCHCEHQPLTNDLRLMSRAKPDAGSQPITALPSGDSASVPAPSVGAALRTFGPCGHTPLSDRLSICLRC